MELSITWLNGSPKGEQISKSIEALARQLLTPHTDLFSRVDITFREHKGPTCGRIRIICSVEATSNNSNLSVVAEENRLQDALQCACRKLTKASGLTDDTEAQ